MFCYLMPSLTCSLCRRSRSTDADLWLDHRPVLGGAIPGSTVLQPVLKKRRSVTHLQPEDVVNDRTKKYVLTTASQDGVGEVTTKLYKVGGARLGNLDLLALYWSRCVFGLF